MNLNEFLHMGGYGFYVWTSYGISLLVLMLNIIAPLNQRKKLLADIARKLRRARSRS
jgi:heme exporter protein D